MLVSPLPCSLSQPACFSPPLPPSSASLHAPITPSINLLFPPPLSLLPSCLPFHFRSLVSLLHFFPLFFSPLLRHSPIPLFPPNLSSPPARHLPPFFFFSLLFSLFSYPSLLSPSHYFPSSLLSPSPFPLFLDLSFPSAPNYSPFSFLLYKIR